MTDEIEPKPGTDPQVQVAALTAMALGWRLFGPFVQGIAGLGDRTIEDLTETVYALVRRSVVGEDDGSDG
ncbi:hypothetical protein [Pseudonocardia xishanensis]|uniref:TetR family transcriptional regulator n=1 Tax=Pseudonocardia xishanensis TaxID=630995 RepID=A0ABP8RRQ3_9PSEU